MRPECAALMRLKSVIDRFGEPSFRQSDRVRTQVAMDQPGAMGRRQGERQPLCEIDDVLLGQLAGAQA